MDSLRSLACWGWLVGAIVLVAISARSPPSEPEGRHLAPLLPRPELLRGVGEGYRQLLADYYWVETIQAVGGGRTYRQIHDAYDYANLVISLDPKFKPIYEFAGAALPTRDSHGVWHNTKESTEILREGVGRFPKAIFIRILLAYNLMAFDHEYAKAATLLERTSRMKGAPSFVAGLATRLYAQAGEYGTGIMFAKTLAATAKDPETKKMFEKRAKAIELDKIVHEIDSASRVFEQRMGRIPVTVWALVQAGLLPTVPSDPFGGTIILDANGNAHSTVEKKTLGLDTKLFR